MENNDEIEVNINLRISYLFIIFSMVLVILNLTGYINVKLFHCMLPGIIEFTILSLAAIGKNMD